MITLCSTIGLITNFTWQDALFLHKWEMCVFPPDNIEQQIILTAHVMQKIHDYFGKPITVTSWLRPKAYNAFIGSKDTSPHLEGKAVDFQVAEYTADQVRAMLMPKLDEFMIRMERNPFSDYVHIDVRDPGPGGRYFDP